MTTSCTVVELEKLHKRSLSGEVYIQTQKAIDRMAIGHLTLSRGNGEHVALGTCRVIDPSYSATPSPRGGPGLHRAKDAPRNLAPARYERLQDIGSAEAFHTVFLDIVRAHHRVYATYGVLHGNISIENIMWHRQDDRMVGVLCDWELASYPYFEGERDWEYTSPASARGSPSSRSEHEKQCNMEREDGLLITQFLEMQSYHRADTFLAIDFLRGDRYPVYKYRHDLESFFYIYVYTAAIYDPPNQSFNKCQQNRLFYVWGHRRRFFTEEERWQNVFARAHCEFLPLFEDGSAFMRLWGEFFNIEVCRNDNPDSWRQHTSYLWRPTGKAVEIEKKRDAMMTFSKFMELLGAAEDT